MYTRNSSMSIPKSSKSPQDCMIRLCDHGKSKTEDLATGREQVNKKHLKKT